MSFNYSPRIITEGLVLCLDAANTRSYPTTGTIWSDLSRNSNNGTLINGPTFNSSNGGSIVFDGINDYVFKDSPVNVGNNFSVSAWIKPSNIATRNAIVGNSYPYSGRIGFLLTTATGYNSNLNTFFLTIGQDASYRIAANNSLTLNQWNHVSAVVLNGGGSILLYKDGVETQYRISSLSSGTILYTANQFYVGARYSTGFEPFRGDIAQVSIYNRALSAQEVLQNYNATKSRFGLT